MARRGGSNRADYFRKQQAVLAEFGLHALRTHEIGPLLQRATDLISQALEIDLVKVLELQTDGRTMLVRAGVNWSPGVVGHAVFGADLHSPAGYALRTDAPVISDDLAKEKRFKIPQVLKDHNVRSMVNVVIKGERAPYGVLEVDAQKPIKFTGDDISFLQNYANILAAAIERIAVQEELAAAERTRSLMLRELQHRLKNMIMNIQAIARRTQLASANMSEFMQSFTARLQAISRAQDLLTEIATETVSIRDIFTKELEAHGLSEGIKITLTGEEIHVPAKDAWGLSLIFHELMTNAQKYGAASVVNGSIAVSWRRGGEGNSLSMKWRERGVSIETAPSKKGFGSEIIREAVPRRLGGTATLVFHPDGLEYSLECRLPLATPSKDHPNP